MLARPLLLASASPRRRALLAMVGIPHTVQPADVDETPPPGLEPAALVRHLAAEKALAHAHARPADLFLGADTIVVLDGEVLNKPADAAEAKAMLRRLSGRTHTVFTGLALVHLATARRLKLHEATDVTFAPLTDDEIDAYVATGSPLDKAGAYGIQDDRGALYVERIDGDYYTVVGLPLHRLYHTLKTSFADLLADATVPSKD